MSKVIDLTAKLETSKTIAELRSVIDRVDKDTRNDPETRAKVLAELNKGIFRLELLQQVLEHGYEPSEFLVNPNERGAE